MDRKYRNSFCSLSTRCFDTPLHGNSCRVEGFFVSWGARLCRSLLLVGLFGMFSLPLWSQKQKEGSLVGKVLTADRKSPLPYAVLTIEELRISITAQKEGDYAFANLPNGTYTLRTHCLGYAQKQTTIKVQGNTSLHVFLSPLSLHLPEVNVMARANKQAGSSIKITNEAIEHIQPSNLRDIFQLLPGQLTTDGTMTSVNALSLRQSGSDANTGLGMSIVTDGVPLSNNANMQLLRGDSKLIARSTVGEGTDLRLLSTDHIQEVEVVQGISSAEYGDLSSGMVLTKAKTGLTPWEARVKADASTKLAYLGKGFKVGQWGTLHAGLDYTYATPRRTSDLDNYTRITAQLTHQVGRQFLGRYLHSDTKLSLIATLDRSKNDPDLTKGFDTYKADYTRIMLSNKGQWQLNAPWLQRLNYAFSVDYAADLLERKRSIVLMSPTPLPLSTENGEQEGIYLPNYYTSDYRIEGRPFSFYGTVKGGSVQKWGRSTHSFRAGIDFRLEKNFGAGSLYDLKTPPAPTSRLSSRPRRFDAIPASHHWAFFLEDRMTAYWNEHLLQVAGGVRGTWLGNLPTVYTHLHDRLQFEPRLNILWRLPQWKWGDRSSHIAFRGGFGQQVKQPTLSMLYPEAAYFDYISANYYSQTAANSFLWVTTHKRPTENPLLQPNRNTKWEIGAEWHWDKAMLSVTLFREVSNSGFEQQSNYFVTSVNRYKTDQVFPYKPALSDFTQYPDTFLDSYTMTVNASRVVKQGVEYRLVLPRITALRTAIEINGAYYRTTYDVSMPVSYRPTSVHHGRLFPYVGFYSWDRSKVRQRLNTNVWLNTHLPRYGMVFSTVVQMLWDNRSQQLPFDGKPTSYMGLDGIVRPFTAQEAADPLLRQLIQSYNSTFFEPDKSPFELSVNMKMSKEIGRIATLSFFVNRLAFYRAASLSKYGLPLSRRGAAASFGTELRIKL